MKSYKEFLEEKKKYNLPKAKGFGDSDPEDSSKGGSKKKESKKDDGSKAEHEYKKRIGAAGSKVVDELRSQGKLEKKIGRAVHNRKKNIGKAASDELEKEGVKRRAKQGRHRREVDEPNIYTMAKKGEFSKVGLFCGK